MPYAPVEGLLAYGFQPDSRANSRSRQLNCAEPIRASAYARASATLGAFVGRDTVRRRGAVCLATTTGRGAAFGFGCGLGFGRGLMDARTSAWITGALGRAFGTDRTVVSWMTSGATDDAGAAVTTGAGNVTGSKTTAAASGALLWPVASAAVTSARRRPVMAAAWGAAVWTRFDMTGCGTTSRGLPSSSFHRTPSWATNHTGSGAGKAPPSGRSLGLSPTALTVPRPGRVESEGERREACRGRCGCPR